MLKDHEDFEAKGQLYHVGARFEALFNVRSHGSFRFRLHFFRILSSGFEQCDETANAIMQIVSRHL